jgi:pyridoxal phosphate enzyme (YggS family)
VDPKLQSNLAAVRARMADAARRGGRSPEGVRLVAVTKSVEPALAADLARLGQLDLGESRAAELERKAEHLGALGLAPRWHFVGHLQGNKVRRVVARAHSIHSIDSARLLEAVDRAAGDLGVRREVWIQVKLADEPSKSGLAPAEVPGLAALAGRLENVTLAGLMALAPLAEAGTAGSSARAVFRDLARLARDLARETAIREALPLGRMATSMGMSGDFEAAIEEGSDLVRVGSLLFEGLAAERAR